MGLMRRSSVRARTYQILEGSQPGDWPARVLQSSIVLLIVISTLAMILESVEPLRDRAETWFRWVEAATIAAFTIEYLARLWSCVEAPKVSQSVPSRVRYVFSPLAIIDLLAILPFFLGFIQLDLRFLRLVRLFRILRLAKLARYSEALQTLGRVVVVKRFELGVTFLLGGILLVIASCLVFVAENEAQPSVYSSIPASMWWSVATLTTVGYGDMFPVTATGKVIGSLIAVCGIGMFALPTGILGAAFVEEMRRRRVSQEGRICPECGQPRGL